MAPELHGIHPPGEEQPILPNATDVWALGEIAHQLLTKRPVFDNVGALYQFVLAIQAFPINKLHQHNVSENAVSLIQQAMSPLPNDRLSADQALQHPWLKLLLPAPSPDLP
jgi:serine/threonine protein kinase